MSNNFDKEVENLKKDYEKKIKELQSMLESERKAHEGTR